MRDEKKHILIAEDDEADVMLMRIVLEECEIADQFVVTSNGEETLDYLYCRGKYQGAPNPVPLLVMLDLKLPKLSGLEILRQIRSDQRLRETPVVIFTSSLAEKDKADCLASGANEFVIKPINFDAYSAALKKIIGTYAATL